MNTTLTLTPSDDVIKATPPHHAKSIGTSPKPTGAPMKKAANPFAVANSLTVRSKRHEALAVKVEKLAEALAAAERNLAAAASVVNGSGWRTAFIAKARNKLEAAAKKQHNKDFKSVRARGKRTLDLLRAKREKLRKSLEEQDRLIRAHLAEAESAEDDRQIQLARELRAAEAKLPALCGEEERRLHDKTQAARDAERSARNALAVAKGKLAELRCAQAKRRIAQLVRRAVTAADFAATELNATLGKIITPSKRDATDTPRSLATAANGHIDTINARLTHEIIEAMGESPTKAIERLAGKIKMAQILMDHDNVPVYVDQGGPEHSLLYYITKWAEESAPRATATASAIKAAAPPPQEYLTPSEVGNTDSEPEPEDTMSGDEDNEDSEDDEDAMSGDENEDEDESDNDPMSDTEEDEDDPNPVIYPAGFGPPASWPPASDNIISGALDDIGTDDM